MDMASWVYFHNLDPFAIQLWGDFGIRWYGLAYIAGFAVCYLCILYLIKKNKTKLSKEELSSLVNYSIFGVLIGGRLGYCLFYQPYLLTKFYSQFPFWGLLEIHKGGMASHGGMMGLCLASILFARKYNKSILHIFDLIVLGSGLGICFGRIANFINGELYGRIVQTATWVGVQFPKEIYEWYTQHHTEKLFSLQKVLPHIGEVKNPFGSGHLPPVFMGEMGAFEKSIYS